MRKRAHSEAISNEDAVANSLVNTLLVDAPLAVADATLPDTALADNPTADTSRVEVFKESNGVHDPTSVNTPSSTTQWWIDQVREHVPLTSEELWLKDAPNGYIQAVQNLGVQMPEIIEIANNPAFPALWKELLKFPNPNTIWDIAKQHEANPVPPPPTEEPPKFTKFEGEVVMTYDGKSFPNEILFKIMDHLAGRSVYAPKRHWIHLVARKFPGSTSTSMVYGSRSPIHPTLCLNKKMSKDLGFVELKKKASDPVGLIFHPQRDLLFIEKSFNLGREMRDFIEAVKAANLQDEIRCLAVSYFVLFSGIKSDWGLLKTFTNLEALLQIENRRPYPAKEGKKNKSIKLGKVKEKVPERKSKVGRDRELFTPENLAKQLSSTRIIAVKYFTEG
ncbi:hypothetical protein G7Y89_g13297 [Cudoniella acicularis]|uniref:Uncharacterized protein n=1 Tax=Cudoniella acicularis TaxID=354080 RepID=A0A8H4R8U1_9HELO|nr:hypothetical protein G7Y89_g13297 [Cudoniella acicularis]